MKTRFALCAVALAGVAGCTPAAFAPLAPSPVDSAARRPLAPGQRVRVTAPSAGMHNQVATVESSSADTLVLELEDIWTGRHLRSVVPLGSVQVLELSRGKHGHAEVGAALGGLLGFIAGGIADRDCQHSCGMICICPFRLVGTVLGVGLGALSGAGTDL